MRDVELERLIAKRKKGRRGNGPLWQAGLAGVLLIGLVAVVGLAAMRGGGEPGQWVTAGAAESPTTIVGVVDAVGGSAADDLAALAHKPGPGRAAIILRLADGRTALCVLHDGSLPRPHASTPLQLRIASLRVGQVLTVRGRVVTDEPSFLSLEACQLP